MNCVSAMATKMSYCSEGHCSFDAGTSLPGKQLYMGFIHSFLLKTGVRAYIYLNWEWQWVAEKLIYILLISGLGMGMSWENDTSWFVGSHKPWTMLKFSACWTSLRFTESGVLPWGGKQKVSGIPSHQQWAPKAFKSNQSSLARVHAASMGRWTKGFTDLNLNAIGAHLGESHHSVCRVGAGLWAGLHLMTSVMAESNQLPAKTGLFH